MISTRLNWTVTSVPEPFAIRHHTHKNRVGALEDMAKIDTTELEHAALDWAVAKALEIEVAPRMPPVLVADLRAIPGVPSQGLCVWEPSVNWAQAGPIIERERIEVSPADEAWRAVPDRQNVANGNAPWLFGGTPLVAAMRCYVLTKLGPEIEVPDELAQRSRTDHRSVSRPK
jgi:hypothetical protein